MTHVIGECVLNGAKIGYRCPPNVLGIGRLPTAVGMEWRFDEFFLVIYYGHTAALHGAQHDVGTDAAVEICLAVYLIAEVISFLLMFVNVLHCPGARDDGLHPEDVTLAPIDFGLHYTGYVGLEFYIVDDEEFSVFAYGDNEVTLIGALFYIAGVETENAGRVGGRESD